MKQVHEELLMKLLVVMVSYRVTDLTIDCLRSLSSEIDRYPARGLRYARTELGEMPPNYSSKLLQITVGTPGST